MTTAATYLILWAISSGALPGGSSAPVVPGGQAQWFSQVDGWINGGMRRK
jgi:hypothetical protein